MGYVVIILFAFFQIMTAFNIETQQFKLFFSDIEFSIEEPLFYCDTY